MLGHAAISHTACEQQSRQTNLIPESEINILEVPVSALSHPVLLHGGVAMLTPHIQHKQAMLVRSFMRNAECWDGHLEGEEA